MGILDLTTRLARPVSRLTAAPDIITFAAPRYQHNDLVKDAALTAYTQIHTQT